MPLKELALVAMLIYGQSVKAELLQVAILARHGNRAPNDDAPILCPNFLPTLKMFDVPYESLTGRGMEQLLELGNDMRDTYIKNLSFIPADLDMNTLYLRAGDSSRTLQSGSAFGMGLYPIGTGPSNFNKTLPPPLPIHTDDEDSDSVLEVRKAQCKRRRKRDEQIWKETTGQRWLKKNRALINQISKLCGGDILAQEDPFAAIKVINDAFIFAHKEGFPRLKGLTEDLAWNFSGLAQGVLYDKFFATPYKNAYMAGDFPSQLVTNFVKAARGEPSSEENRLVNAYFCHREVSYGVSEMMGVPKFQYHEGSPVSELPPGGTFIWELHRVKAKDGHGQPKHIVKFGTYVPCSFQGELKEESTKCGFHWVKLPNCDIDEDNYCTLEEFDAVFDRFRDRYGHWREICGTRSRPGPRVMRMEGSNQEWQEGYPDLDENGWYADEVDYYAGHYGSDDVVRPYTSKGWTLTEIVPLWQISMCLVSMASMYLGIRIGSLQSQREKINADEHDVKWRKKSIHRSEGE